LEPDFLKNYLEQVEQLRDWNDLAVEQPSGTVIRHVPNLRSARQKAAKVTKIGCQRTKGIRATTSMDRGLICGGFESRNAELKSSAFSLL
jgi:hypothetical protein